MHPSTLVRKMRNNWKKEKTRLLCLTGIFVLLMVSLAGAEDFKLKDPEDFKIRLDAGQQTILVDIQNKNAYKEHHFYGSIRTHAYPAKTELDTQSLVQAVRLYERTQNDVVIIGPRGGRACRRTQDFLITRGIPIEKFFILKGGIKN